MLNRAKTWRGWALWLVALGACAPYVEGHAVASHTAGDVKHVDASQVRVSALIVPEGATELGIVQAHTNQGSIEDAMPEFRKQVAQLGGDFGKVNNVDTKFETQTRTSTETYNCGSSDKPSSCTRTVTEVVEVSTTRILGKAYRLAAAILAATAPAGALPPPTPAATSPSPEGATNAP